MERKDMNKKICIYASLFVVAMFLLTTVTTTATTAINGQHQIQLVEEEPTFPDELPFGTSSISCITICRAIDFWHGAVYDVGFSIFSMRLRNGAEHHKYMPSGMITITYHKGQIPQYIPLTPSYIQWDGWVLGGFSINRDGTVIIDQPFYSAIVHGWIYKDLGAPEYLTRDLTGYNYFLENNLLGSPMEIQQMQGEGIAQG